MNIENMKNKAYRHGMVNAQIEIDLPLQIRALRKQRVWTQPQLAAEAEMKQPRISAMEKPGAVHFTLETLRRLAEAFDVALIVRFAPFSEFIDSSNSFRPDEFLVPTFDEEYRTSEPNGVATVKEESGHLITISATGGFGCQKSTMGQQLTMILDCEFSAEVPPAAQPPTLHGALLSPKYSEEYYHAGSRR